MTKLAYATYTQDQLDAEYNTRALTPCFQEFVDGWTADTTEVKAALRCQGNIAYGPSKAEILDIFPVDRNTPAPVHIFFHGGGWRSMSKDVFGYIARAFHRHGVMTIVVNYALCPAVNLDELVRQCRAAIAWTWQHASEYGGDNTRIFISGHSAGAHVSAMAAVTDWPSCGGIPADVIKGVTAISGLYELEAVRLSATYAPLGFTPEQVLRNSPLTLDPPKGMPFIVALGAHESREFHRQSYLYADMLRKAGVGCEYHCVAGHHHYSVLDAYENDRHSLGRSVLNQMGLA